MYNGGLAFAPDGDALYVVDTEGRTVYRITSAAKQADIDLYEASNNPEKAKEW